MVFTPDKQRCLTASARFDDFFASLQDSLQRQQRRLGPARWLHLSLPLPDLDPLAAMAQLDGFAQPHFYWEQPSQGLAIAAAESALTAEFSGPERFVQAQALVLSQLNRTSSLTAAPLPWPTAPEPMLPLGDETPRFFCSFTFFDHVAAGSPFPPALLLLPRWQVIRRRAGMARGSSTHFGANLALTQGRLCAREVKQLWHRYQQLCLVDATALQRACRQQRSTARTDLRGDRFEAAVEAVLAAIDQGQLHKAVMAHRLEVNASSPFSPAAALAALRSRHPDCYSFSVGRGQGPVFLGASPERLLQVRQRHLYTEALAGSASRSNNPALDIQLAQSLSRSAKELHEHQLVADFITQKLRSLGLSPVQAAGPQVLQLTGIQHLQTPIHCPLPPSIHPFEVLARLHPTPAVAGVPRRAACVQIQQREGFERSLYAAPLGWIDGRGNGEFCVGIRSALLSGCQAELFAGAGIVSGSVPQQELAEIELKLRTLLCALTA